MVKEGEWHRGRIVGTRGEKIRTKGKNKMGEEKRKGERR